MSKEMKLRNVGWANFDNEDSGLRTHGGNECTLNKNTPNKIWSFRSPNPGPTNFRQKILTEGYGEDFINNAKKVLEIGFGCGRNAQFFMNETDHIDYYGFDTSKVGLKYFLKQDFPKDRYYVSTDIDEEILSQRYDLIFHTYVFHHVGFLPDKKGVYDAKRITKTLFPLLKVGGYWLSHEGFSGDNGWSNPRWRKESFNEDEIKIVKMVGDCGLEGGPESNHVLYVIKKIK